MSLHTETKPQFESVRWTGENQSEIEALVQKYRPKPWTWSVIGADGGTQEGNLSGSAYFDYVYVPAGHFLVFGPIWGPELASETAASTVTPAMHEARFPSAA